ncbi:MAG TPA: IPT/TIG domain-containing protein [Chitinophagaceae bacterium]
MKLTNILSSGNRVAMLLIFSLAAIVVSCKKDTDGSPDYSAGTPTFSAITPGEGAGGTVVTITGSGLGRMSTIVFDNANVPATFQPNLNTESSIVFRVPDTAYGGQQNIVLTNVDGKMLTVPFKVIALPKVTDVSNYNFNTGSQITLIGNNLGDVSSVVLTGTTTAATIISKSRKEMVIEMPATTLSKTTLDLTNTSGKVTTSQEFISLANNFIIYSDGYGPGAYNSGVQSWSWATTVSEVNDIVKTGTKALKADYQNGGLSLFLGSNWATPALNFTDFHNPKPSALAFYARNPGTTPITIVIQPDGGAGSFTATGQATVSVPANNQWTYFRIPYFLTGNFSRLNLRVQTTATIYFDDILWIK